MVSMDSSMPTEWADMQLDTRILEALADLKWAKPMTVQSACIPRALKGANLSIQSRTGSGKTAAFVIPIVQRILMELEVIGHRGRRGDRAELANPVALFIVPSVELCEQTVEVTQEIAKYVKPRLVIENLTSGHHVTNSRQVTAAHIVVSTAALLAKCCRDGSITADTLRSLRYLVMDEADMLMSIAEMSMRTIQSMLPNTMQVILCSATLTEDVAALKGRLLLNPVNIVLTSSSSDYAIQAKNKTDFTAHGATSPSSASSGGGGGDANRATHGSTKRGRSESAASPHTRNNGDVALHALQTSPFARPKDEEEEEDATTRSHTVPPLLETSVIIHDPRRRALRQHYLVASDACHHHTLLYALYRFRLLEGKTLIFVNREEDTYKLQHFLDQLGIATLLYDTSLPMNVRLDTLRRFQRGAVSTLVCTDSTLESAAALQMSLHEEQGEEDVQTEERNSKRSHNSGSSSSSNNKSNNTTQSQRKGQTDRKAAHQRSGAHTVEHGNNDNASALHRGIDFAHVRNVILFNGVEASSPVELSRYTHRIGRVARAGAEGLAISLFTVPQARKDLPLLKEYCHSKGDAMVPFRALQRSEASKLQYRVDTVLANVTRSATRRLRVATVAAEMGRSAYLTHHLSQHDTEALQRVVRRSAKKVRVERELLDVPAYMQLRGVDEVREYTRRVRANQTRASQFRNVTRKSPRDALHAVAAKLRASRQNKKP